MDIFSNLFGYVLNWLYNVVGQNFGIAIILFTVIVRLVLLPITIKQQKSMKKTNELQGRIKAIQFKYANNQEQMQKEIMDLYKKEKVSPFSGCLSAILQLVIILSVFWLISKPLTYMKKIDNSIIDGYKNEISEENGGNTSNYYEIEIINKKASQDENVRINMDFMGLDLSKVPSQNLTDYTVYIIPALYIISSFVSMRFMTNKKKPSKNALGDGSESKSAEEEMTEKMTKSMSMITPIMAVSIAFIAPLGLALYWFISNILMIVERVTITKYVDSKEEK